MAVECRRRNDFVVNPRQDLVDRSALIREGSQWAQHVFTCRQRRPIIPRG
jgi:hypothetical protein